MALIRRSGPDSGLGFQVHVLEAVQGAPFSRGSKHLLALSSLFGLTKVLESGLFCAAKITNLYFTPIMSRLDSGLGFQVHVLETLQVFSLFVQKRAPPSAV